MLENAVGDGGCGGIIVNPTGEDILFNKPVGRMVDNVESEVAGIAEGIKEAVKMLECVWKSKEELDTKGVKLYLAWTPGHCGIKYNDSADIQAKKAPPKC